MPVRSPHVFIVVPPFSVTRASPSCHRDGNVFVGRNATRVAFVAPLVPVYDPGFVMVTVSQTITLEAALLVPEYVVVSVPPRPLTALCSTYAW